MLTFATITKWESHRDSKQRVPKRQQLTGRVFLINTNRITNLVSTGASTCKFRFIENWDDRQEAWDYMEANESIASLRSGHDTLPTSKFITLPIYEKNNLARHTINTTIEVDDIVYADANNADTSTSWVVYIREGFKRIEALVNLDLTEIYNLVGALLLDYDGNEYDTVIIGNQQWIVQNLRTTHYGDGTAIPETQDNVAWLADTTGTYCWYDNDIGNMAGYGALYNWYTTTNIHGLAYFTRGGVQEAGWRIPSIVDWATLIIAVGGDYFTAGGLLKEAGDVHWGAGGNMGTNTYGFTAVGNGNRDVDTETAPGFLNIGHFGDTWALDTDPFDIMSAYAIWTEHGSDSFYVWTHEKYGGMAVRAVRDI